MTYRKVNYEEVDRVSGAMHFLREPLDSEQVGVTIAKCEPGWIGQRHDHTENGHEEIYILIDGRATVVVDDDPVKMKQGDALWIDPTSDRQIRNSDQESTFVLVSAPELVDGDGNTGGNWSLTGFQG
ncbi:cupin domain-containing protein [Natronocalculus amylovorans]|uniref:Cupin domain-containing protein n=1 Tax=Natronocalculus amylovorans TaxID=2917812 RepID=A0AAE3K9T3_9EURY|nr:cupin domain-containing protein [Natronocalculus amylovorans]MCL9818396.1 cupin domain-containing protein [Natronocalculus amylovorans]NUE02489.1 cupin domain-containing protein [Halorubraceae archaeon YAN]